MVDIKRITQVKNPKKFYFYSIILGIICGFIALGFSYLLSMAEYFTFEYLAGINMGKAAGEISFDSPKEELDFRPFIFFMLPILGGYISGLLVEKFDPKAGGAGTDALIHAFHNDDGKVSGKTPLVKGIATIFNLAGGGSAGKEGPVAQIGSSIGSVLSSFLGLGARARRSLFIAGMAGSLGAIFLAPLGAAIIAVEVIYREDFESDTLIPAIISSITGYFVFTSFRGFGTIFYTTQIGFYNGYELFFYFALGIVCSFFGFIFVKLYNFIRDYFEGLSIRISIKTTIGGLVVALIGYFSWESIGNGFGFLQKLLQNEELLSHSHLSQYFLKGDGSSISTPEFVQFLLMIAILKIISTSFSIGSGASGGVFGPSIFIGGFLGAAVGFAGNYWFPEIVTSPISYAIVGMGGFFSGVANAPIGPMIMVCELTGSYQLLAPLLLVTILNIILSSKFSIYRGQRLNKFHSPAHRWDMNSDFLGDLLIKDSLHELDRSLVLKETDSMDQLIKISLDKKTKETDFIVINDKNEYVGLLSLRKIQKSKLSRVKENISSMVQKPPPLHLQGTLTDVLDFLLNWDFDKAPIVDDQKKMKGYISFKDLLVSYRENVKEIKNI